MLWEWSPEPAAPVAFRKWFAWGALLVLIYLLLTAVTWGRMLIDTEAWALTIAGLPFSEQMAQVRGDLVHPPLMYLIHRGWFAAFGQSDTAARLLPLFIVSPAILLLTLLATRITAEWRLLSFVLATLFFQVGGAATSARMYGLALLLVSSALLLWDNWQANPRNGTLAAWTAILLLLVYTHLFGLLILFAFLVLNWLQGPRKLAFTIASFVPGIAFLPWFFYVLPVYLERLLSANLTWVHKKLISALPALFFNFLGPWAVQNFSLNRMLIAVSAVLHLGLLVLWWLNRRSFGSPLRPADAAQRWFWVAFILTGLPVAILFGFSVVAARAFEARFVLGAVLSYNIFLFLLCRLSGRAGWIALLCVLIPWKLVSIGTAIHFTVAPDPARERLEFVVSQVRAGDMLLLDNPNHNAGYSWEWLRRMQRTEPFAVLPDEAGRPQLLVAAPPTPLERLELSGIQRIWVLQAGREPRHGLTESLTVRGFLPSPQPAGASPSVQLFAR
ncbi:MAG: hypothetical protein M1451_05720 [Acidobacteria bacterium]|nr:hypothetical protein [Acidobacteriota bacterium]